MKFMHLLLNLTQNRKRVFVSDVILRVVAIYVNAYYYC